MQYNYRTSRTVRCHSPLLYTSVYIHSFITTICTFTILLYLCPHCLHVIALTPVVNLLSMNNTCLVYADMTRDVRAVDVAAAVRTEAVSSLTSSDVILARCAERLSDGDVMTDSAHSDQDEPIINITDSGTSYKTIRYTCRL